jgi:uncharacterized protein (UPF0333 family)
MLKRKIINQPKKKKQGQSTVEYIILVAAILAALIVFLSSGGVFQSAYNSTLISGTNGMQSQASVLASSHYKVNATP